jgi:hypothetical protein
VKLYGKNPEAEKRYSPAVCRCAQGDSRKRS